MSRERHTTAHTSNCGALCRGHPRANSNAAPPHALAVCGAVGLCREAAAELGEAGSLLARPSIRIATCLAVGIHVCALAHTHRLRGDHPAAGVDKGEHIGLGDACGEGWDVSGVGMRGFCACGGAVVLGSWCAAVDGANGQRHPRRCPSSPLTCGLDVKGA
jgi:hypothetical protein